MKGANTVNKFFLGTALCTLFLQFGISTFIWENIPFFRYISFPHRWLNITAFSVVFLSSVLFWRLGSSYKTKKERTITVIIFCFICIVSALLINKYIGFSPVINKQELVPVKAANWYREHLPIWVDTEKINKSEDMKQAVAIQKGSGKADVVAWKSAERVIEIKASQPITLWIRTFNFPGWKAYIDGINTEIETEKDVGAILLDIPEGRHTVLLKFVDTPIRYYSKLISLSSLLIVVVAIFFKRTKKKQKET
jgi:hypothetical protein